MQLDELISPVPKQEFLARYWETEPLFVSRNRPDYLSHLFALRELDYLLGRHPADAKIYLAGNKKKRTRATTPVEADVTDLGGLYEGFYQGQTIIVNGLHRLWDPVSRLCRDLVAETGMQVHANLYITPQGGVGFDCHWDGHDVMILQLEGAKKWNLYTAATPLPRPTSSGGVCQKREPPVRTLTLQSGDFLYLPRGTPHQATAADEPSVHLTVGLTATTWEDLFVAAVQTLSARNGLLRKALPCGWLSDPEALAPCLNARREFTHELFGERNMQDALALLSREVFESMPSPTDGHFTQLDLVDRIGLDTTLGKRSGDLLRVGRTGDQSLLFFPGGSCGGHSKLFWAFTFMADSGSFKVRDIPGWYSDEERLAIVRSLVRRGFLRIITLTSTC